MIYSDMTNLIKRVFREVEALREAGQKEYARDQLNTFANFERVAEWLGTTRERVLMTYMLKHLDGICAFVEGHHSQREDVRGRINDLIVYALLLRGMVEEEPATVVERSSQTQIQGDPIFKQAIPIDGTAAAQYLNENLIEG